MTGEDDATGGVKELRIADLKRLGIDDRNRLYWDGKRIEVRQRIALSIWQRRIAIAVSLCAMLGGLGSCVSGLNNASLFFCSRGYDWLRCPPSLLPAVAPTPHR